MLKKGKSWLSDPEYQEVRSNLIVMIISQNAGTRLCSQIVENGSPYILSNTRQGSKPSISPLGMTYTILRTHELDLYPTRPGWTFEG